MRDRLIELLKTQHKADYLRKKGITVGNYEEESNEALIADYLLENGVIVPPCKVGDVVWDNDFGRPCSYIVTGFDIGKTLDDEENHKGMFMYYENHNGSVQCNCPITQVGKTVFLSKEEAERALKGGAQE